LPFIDGFIAKGLFFLYSCNTFLVLIV